MYYDCQKLGSLFRDLKIPQFCSKSEKKRKEEAAAAAAAVVVVLVVVVGVAAVVVTSSINLSWEKGLWSGYVL